MKPVFDLIRASAKSLLTLATVVAGWLGFAAVSPELLRQGLDLASAAASQVLSPLPDATRAVAGEVVTGASVLTLVLALVARLVLVNGLWALIGGIGGLLFGRKQAVAEIETADAPDAPVLAAAPVMSAAPEAAPEADQPSAAIAAATATAIAGLSRRIEDDVVVPFKTAAHDVVEDVAEEVAEVVAEQVETLSPAALDEQFDTGALFEELADTLDMPDLPELDEPDFPDLPPEPIKTDA